jgi:hypothetical protein
MTPDRLNDHVKRATGVASHLIAARSHRSQAAACVPNQAIHEIATISPFQTCHFTGFRKQTGMTPQLRHRGGWVFLRVHESCR